MVEVSVTVGDIVDEVRKAGRSSGTIPIAMVGRGAVTVGIWDVHILLRESEVEGYSSGRVIIGTDIDVLRSMRLTHVGSISTKSAIVFNHLVKNHTDWTTST